MNKVLIIGASGNIGFELVKILSNKMDIVAATSNIKRSQAKFSERENISLCKFDFLDPSTYKAAVKDVQTVFFVRPPHLAKPQTEIFPFIDYLKSVNVINVVFVSLLGVESNKRTPHFKIEQYLESNDFNYTFVRPSFFMQNIITTHKEDVINNRDLFIPAGKSLTSFIDTDDIANFCAHIILNHSKHYKQKYDITGAQAISYFEVAEILSTNTKQTYIYSQPSLFKFRRTVIKRGEAKDKANVMTMLYLITQLGNAKEVTNTYQEITGEKPTSFTEFVQKNIDLFTINN